MYSGRGGNGPELKAGASHGGGSPEFFEPGSMSEQLVLKVGIIGLGMMGTAIADGLLAHNSVGAIFGTRRAGDVPLDGRERPGISLKADNRELAAASDVVILAVKPYQAQAIIEEIAPLLQGKLLVSICASLTTGDLRRWAGDGVNAVRTMPNTPCLIGRGMTVIARDGTSAAEHLTLVEKLFTPLGRTAILDESLMDAVTGLSGCGPAYVFLIVEALSEAGVKLGIDRKTSTLLVAQTLLGGAEMLLARGEHPAKLKDEVTTPAGCTVDALMVLEDGRLRSTLIHGVMAAAERSKALRSAAASPGGGR